MNEKQLTKAYNHGFTWGMKATFKILEEEYEKYNFTMLDKDYLFTKNALLDAKKESKS